jgi:hypothetical protein
MPPSRHASGRKYRWLRRRGPGYVRAAWAPEWLWRRQQEGGARGQGIEAGAPISEGQRNTRFFKIACALRSSVARRGRYSVPSAVSTAAASHGSTTGNSGTSPRTRLVTGPSSKGHCRNMVRRQRRSRSRCAPSGCLTTRPSVLCRFLDSPHPPKRTCEVPGIRPFPCWSPLNTPCYLIVKPGVLAACVAPHQYLSGPAVSPPASICG